MTLIYISSSLLLLHPCLLPCPTTIILCHSLGVYIKAVTKRWLAARLQVSLICKTRSWSYWCCWKSRFLQLGPMLLHWDKREVKTKTGAQRDLGYREHSHLCYLEVGHARNFRAGSSWAILLWSLQLYLLTWNLLVPFLGRFLVTSCFNFSPSVVVPQRCRNGGCLGCLSVSGLLEINGAAVKWIPWLLFRSLLRPIWCPQSRFLLEETQVMAPCHKPRGLGSPAAFNPTPHPPPALSVSA